VSRRPRMSVAGGEARLHARRRLHQGAKVGSEIVLRTQPPQLNGEVDRFGIRVEARESLLCFVEEHCYRFGFRKVKEPVLDEVEAFRTFVGDAQE
jgi:hypothetical protein